MPTRWKPVGEVAADARCLIGRAATGVNQPYSPRRCEGGPTYCARRSHTEVRRYPEAACSPIGDCALSCPRPDPSGPGVHRTWAQAPGPRDNVGIDALCVAAVGEGTRGGTGELCGRDRVENRRRWGEVEHFVGPQAASFAPSRTPRKFGRRTRNKQCAVPIRVGAMVKTTVVDALQFVVLAAFVGVLGCSEFNTLPLDGGTSTDTSRATPPANIVPVDAPVTSTVGGGTDACPFGTHACAGQCTSDNSPDSCGASCEPCPQVAGGVATCDGIRCSGKCPAGQKPCVDKCIAEADTCVSSCAPGFHSCGGLCSDNMKVSSCGPLSCASCPVPPPGAVATCDGTACGFSCQVGKRCADKCGECCADADCTAARPGQNAICDLVALKCKCPPQMTDCNGQCIPTASCCSDADCHPDTSGKQGKCDVSSHSCQYMCIGDAKPCGGKCIPSRGCCDDAGCPGNHACTNSTCSESVCRSGFKVCAGTCISSSACCQDSDCAGDFACIGNACSKTACRTGFKNCGNRCILSGGCCTDGECQANHACINDACSGSQCRSGYKTCGSDCIAMAICCRATGCCTNDDCPKCNKCSNGACVAQSDREDLKDDCGAGTCRTGLCDGRGGCATSPDGRTGPGCDSPAQCQGDMSSSSAVPGEVCQAGQCQRGQPKDCGHFGCSNGQCNRSCPPRFNDSASGCVACGKAALKCCTSGAACDDGLGCNVPPPVDCGVGSSPDCGTCQECGIINNPCCPGKKCNDGLICDSETRNLFLCFPCGGNGQKCCQPNNTCATGLICSQQNGLSFCGLAPTP
jgi:hypothetical protein